MHAENVCCTNRLALTVVLEIEIIQKICIQVFQTVLQNYDFYFKSTNYECVYSRDYQ